MTDLSYYITCIHVTEYYFQHERIFVLLTPVITIHCKKFEYFNVNIAQQNKDIEGFKTYKRGRGPISSSRMSLEIEAHKIHFADLIIVSFDHFHFRPIWVVAKTVTRQKNYYNSNTKYGKHSIMCHVLIISMFCIFSSILPCTCDCTLAPTLSPE